MFPASLLLITILIVLPTESFELRNLAEQSNVSPSPSPSHGVNLASSGLNFQETCSMASKSCHLKNIAACLTYSQSGPYEICLVVQNNDENLVNVKIMILPANKIIKEIQLPGHQMEKINMSSYVELSSTIALDAGDGDCTLGTIAPSPQNLRSYGTYVTPTHGAYLVILVIIIVGGTFVCFKSRIRKRHLDGVPYHELEMGNSETPSSLNVEEDETESWDHDWDDTWGEERMVKSGDEDLEKVKLANGLTANSPDSNGQRKEWDD